MSVDWVGFAAASVAVVLAPGPGSVFVAKAAGVAGPRAGHTAMLGIVLGDSCLIVLSLLGVSALFSAHPALFHTVRLVGAGYLIFLGLQCLLTKPKETSAPLRHSVSLVPRALAITLLNPKAVFFFMAFFPVFIRSTEGGLIVPYAAMTLLFMAVSIGYLCVVSHVASGVGSAFRKNRTIQAVSRKVCGWVFIGFGVKVAIASR